MAVHPRKRIPFGSFVVIACCTLVFGIDVPTPLLNALSSLSGDELTQRGTTALMNGDATLAARVFTVAVANNSHEGTVFNNLATAHATLGAEQENQDLLCEAHAAGELAQVLGHAGAAELVTAIEELLPPAGCPHHALPRQARQQLIMGSVPIATHIEQIKSLCATPDAVSVRATPQEKVQRAWSAVQLHRIWLLMRVCGVVTLDGMLDPQVVASFARKQAEHAESGAEIAPHQRFAGTDAASRGSMRQEVRLSPGLLFEHLDIIARPLLHSLVGMLLGEQVELDTLSYIASLPGCLDQNWHNDVPTPPGGNCHAPPMGLVAIVPLVDVSVRNGATEFLPGSHVQANDARFWMDPESPGGGGATTAVPHLQPSAPVGSLVLFDIRLRHRGRANADDSKRTILYMSYVQEWFRDGVNFREKQTRAWDTLPERARTLLARLDARDYVTQLEDALVAQGVDLSRLRSFAGTKVGISSKRTHPEL